MGKKISLGAAIAFMAIVAAITFSFTLGFAQTNFNDKVNNMKEREKRYSKVAEIDEIVRTNYVDAGALDQDALVDALAGGYLSGSHDKYAKYYTAKEYAALQGGVSNEQVQIGIVPVRDESGYIRVAQVYPDSPAQAADIAVGDLIVKIDDTAVTAENYSAAEGLLVGAAGTKMNIVLRKGAEEGALEMTRRFVEVPSVTARLLEGGVGLVVFKEFNANTPAQFFKQVEGLKDAQSLIFDVRGVDKGTLDSVGEILGRLMPEGPLVSSTDKSGTVTVLKVSDGRGEIMLPMAVLMNEKTSGEAELFAQVLKDGNKAKLVGLKTMGKGTMQRRFKLVDGSAVEITTARYNPPISPSFDGEGVKPDYEVKLTDDQLALMLAGVENSDLQLNKAVEIMGAAAKSTTEAEPVPSETQSVPEGAPESVASADSSAPAELALEGDGAQSSRTDSEPPEEISADDEADKEE